MRARRHDERGDSLLEVVLALVVISLVFGVFFATYTTQGAGSTAHRTYVTGDGVLRSYAEATKAAVRKQCTPGGTFSVSYTPPTGFSVNPLTNVACPPQTTPSTTFAAGEPWAPLTLTVTLPNSQTRSLALVVRSP